MYYGNGQLGCLQSHKKADGTFNVKIRVYHKKEKKYIDTQHFVTRKQLGLKGKIKDPIISQLLDETLLAYRKEINDLKWKLEYLTCEQLRDHLKDRDEDINFIAFCTEHIELLFEGNREERQKTIPDTKWLNRLFQKRKFLNHRNPLQYAGTA